MRIHMLKVGTAAVTLALITAGATAVHSNSSTTAVEKAAEADARDAARSLAKGKTDAAVRYAEHAVQLRPQDASYRALLGKAYLAAGRFFSARQAFADTLQLDPSQPGAALNLALVTTATGDFAAAQDVLSTYASAISEADRGLAFALAGNPAAAVEILLPAARALDSTAKTRQNLALAFALAGRWPDARQVALADLSPADADARIVQWAAFARPTAASDQVASLLGVVPIADGGQPAQLALNPSPTRVADAAPVELVAEVPRVETAAVSTPEPEVAAAPAPAPVTIAAPVEAIAAAAIASVNQIVFAERREVVQSLPASPTRLFTPAISTRVRMTRVAAPQLVTPAVATRGDFYVQLGAYDSAAMAKWGWDRARARHAALAGKTPYTMPIGNGLVRVAVGGFARGDADRMCQTIRAKGGACFVRAGAGDRVAGWVRGDVQMASNRGGRVMRLAAR